MICTSTDHYVNTLSTIKKEKKKEWSRFNILRYWPTLHFCFLLSRYLKYKILHNAKTTHFLRNRGHDFAQWLFPQMYTAFKGITPKTFWVRAQTLYASRSWKILCFTEKNHWNTRLAASEVFHMFTKSIK